MKKKKENELNPDALTGGIEKDGLKSTLHINLIICYVIVNVSSPITKSILIESLSSGGIANYFELANGLDSLIEKGFILLDDNEHLIATETCKSLLDFVDYDLPQSIKEKSVSLVSKLSIKEAYKKENEAKVEKVDNIYYVTLKIKDLSHEFMSIKLAFNSSEEAYLVKNKFYENPTEVYNKIIESILE